MKRLALLSAVTMMLVSAVFAPVAMAQEPGEVDVTSVTRGPGGSVTVTATVQCVEGQNYDAFVTVRQRTSGNVFLTASGGGSGICPADGPLTFTFTSFGQVSGENGAEKPFHKGQAVASTFGRLCTPDFFCTPNQETFEEVRIR